MTDGGRAGAWSRRNARRQLYDYGGRNWRPLLAGAASIWVVTALAWALVPPHPLFAFVLGALNAAFIAAVAVLAVVQTGTSTWLLGSWGEQHTSEALKRLRSRGWHLVNGIPLDRGDVDHVLLGPGGAFAIETKNHSAGWDLDRPDRWLAGAVSQAREGAAWLHRYLKSTDVGVEVDVLPVLVLWGRVKGEGRVIDGVEVVPGPDLRSWIERPRVETLVPEDLERAIAGIHRFVAKRDDHISSHDEDPYLVRIGPGAILSDITQGACGLGALVVAGVAAAWLSDPWGVLFLLMLAVPLGFAGRRIAEVRAAATGWLVGAAVSIAALVVAVVRGLV